MMGGLYMRFVEKFEGVVRLADDSVFTTNLYDTYEEANDAIISAAAKDLPNESVKAYQINKVYINTAFPWNTE